MPPLGLLASLIILYTYSQISNPQLRKLSEIPTAIPIRLSIKPLMHPCLRIKITYVRTLFALFFQRDHIYHLITYKVRK